MPPIWRDPGVVYWSLALGALALAALAPTRPWGWTGWWYVSTALLFAVFGLQATRRLPRRARLASVVMGAVLVVLVNLALRVLVPAG